MELVTGNDSGQSEHISGEAFYLSFFQESTMPSRAPRKSRRTPSKPSRAKKTPVLGRLSAARARVKAEVKKGTYKTVKHAATVIATDFEVSPSSLATSMSRSKNRDEDELHHNRNHALNKKEEDMLLAFVLAFDSASMPGWSF